MSYILLIIFFAINVIVFIRFSKNYLGVFSAPSLFAIVSVFFTGVQLVRIIEVTPHPDQTVAYPLLYIILCTLAVPFGFYFGQKLSSNIVHENTEFKWNNIIWIILLFTLIGGYVSWISRGMYIGGFVSGLFVILKFFTSYLDYALFLILIIWVYQKRKMSVLLYAIILFILYLEVDKLITSARRADIIQIVLTLLFFLVIAHRNKVYRIVRLMIIAFFTVGFLMNSLVGAFRVRSLEKGMSFSENIEGLEIDVASATFSTKKDLYGLEIQNAIIGINSCDNYGLMDHDLGLFHWNGIIRNFIPKSLFGAEFKDDIMIDLGTNPQLNKLTQSGSTMTGYFNTYHSFGFMGWLEFFLIAYIMGILWRKMNHSLVSMVLYVSLITPFLHTITHSTGNFVNSVVMYCVLVAPFILLIRQKGLSYKNLIKYNY